MVWYKGDEPESGVEVHIIGVDNVQGGDLVALPCSVHPAVFCPNLFCNHDLHVLYHGIKCAATNFSIFLSLVFEWWLLIHSCSPVLFPPYTAG